MVFKKPYAFLIRYFKLIHLILFGVMLFVVDKFGDINSFFTDYIRHGSKIAENIISSLLYLAVILIISFALGMFLLMRKKKKPTFFYLLILINYTIILIFMFIASGVFASLAEASLTQQAARLYRDIYLIISFPQYYFLVMSLIRGIGFDVKKFNFNKDLEELEIISEDNEEFEFVLGTDAYIYKRKIRRTLREIKYYVLENKLIFSAIAIVFGAGLLYITIANSNILSMFSRVGGDGSIGNFNYKILSSYETAYDYNGNIIREGKSYLIIKMRLTNRSNTPYTFDNTTLFVKVGSNQVYNQPSLRNYFIDIGSAYINEPLPGGATKEYIFIYEIDKKNISKRYQFNILKSVTYEDGQSMYNYAKTKVKPEKLVSNNSKVERKINEVMYFGEALFNKSNLVITKAEILSSYEYKYKSCDKNECKEYYDVIAPHDTATQKILALTYKLNVDEEIGLNLSMNSDKYFFDKFSKIIYNYNGKKLTKEVTGRVYPKLEKMVFIDIPKTGINSDLLYFSIKTRSNDFYINLKDI